MARTVGKREHGGEFLAATIRLVGLCLAILVTLFMMGLFWPGLILVLVPGGILILAYVLGAIAGRCELLLYRQARDRRLLVTLAQKAGVSLESEVEK